MPTLITDLLANAWANADWIAIVLVIVGGLVGIRRTRRDNASQKKELESQKRQLEEFATSLGSIQQDIGSIRTTSNSALEVAEEAKSISAEDLALKKEASDVHWHYNLVDPGVATVHNAGMTIACDVRVQIRVDDPAFFFEAEVGDVVGKTTGTVQVTPLIELIEGQRRERREKAEAEKRAREAAAKREQEELEERARAEEEARKRDPLGYSRMTMKPLAEVMKMARPQPVALNAVLGVQRHAQQMQEYFTDQTDNTYWVHFRVDWKTPLGKNMYDEHHDSYYLK